AGPSRCAAGGRKEFPQEAIRTFWSVPLRHLGGAPTGDLRSRPLRPGCNSRHDVQRTNAAESRRLRPLARADVVRIASVSLGRSKTPAALRGDADSDPGAR